MGPEEEAVEQECDVQEDTVYWEEWAEDHQDIVAE